MAAAPTFDLRKHLLAGQVIPALPLALDSRRRWSERHQRALVRYYLAAGAGGIAVGVHSTQFEIREPKHALYEPVLTLAAETVRAEASTSSKTPLLVAGVCGRTRQALGEARFAREAGYHAGLLSLGAWSDQPERAILRHCRQVAKEIPLIGFYLQVAVGGRAFSYRFWREFAEIPELVAIKIAPFNRYRTIDVVRAIAASGRKDVALYTGNDDNIIADLLTDFRLEGTNVRIVGGLLGQWAVWTERAVRLHADIQKARRVRTGLSHDWLAKNAQLTDANAAVFDVANSFAGCIAGINEVLRRQGLLSSAACLNPKERLSPGQADEITRVARAYPWLVDDAFVARHRDKWLR